MDAACDKILADVPQSNVPRDPFLLDQYALHDAAFALQDLDRVAKILSAGICRCQRTALFCGSVAEDTIRSRCEEAFLRLCREWRGRSKCGIVMTTKKLWFLFRESVRRRGHPYPFDMIRPLTSDWVTLTVVDLLPVLQKENPSQ